MWVNASCREVIWREYSQGSMRNRWAEKERLLFWVNFWANCVRNKGNGFWTGTNHEYWHSISLDLKSRERKHICCLLRSLRSPPHPVHVLDPMFGSSNYTEFNWHLLETVPCWEHWESKQPLHLPWSAVSLPECRLRNKHHIFSPSPLSNWEPVIWTFLERFTVGNLVI